MGFFDFFKLKWTKTRESFMDSDEKKTGDEIKTKLQKIEKELEDEKII